MLGALIIVFREVIEAGIIVGIMLAVTKGVPGRGRWIATGVGAGIAGASLLAVFADQISNALAGIGQELFNAAIHFVTVIMPAWHNIWMARHGRELAAQMKEVGDAVAKGSRSLSAVAIVVAVAVLREGSEIVLFLYGLVIGRLIDLWPRGGRIYRSLARLRGQCAHVSWLDQRFLAGICSVLQLFSSHFSLPDLPLRTWFFFSRRASQPPWKERSGTHPRFCRIQVCSAACCIRSSATQTSLPECSFLFTGLPSS